MTGLAARIAVPTVVRTIPWKAVFGGLVGLAFLVLLAWGLRVNDLRGRWLERFTSEHAARIADRSAYEQAQKDAATQNKAQVVRIEQQYTRNSNDAKEAFLSDLARLRAERLRSQGTPAPQGGAGPASPPKASGGASGAHGDGVQVHPPADVPASEDAAEIELRLMHLQNLVEKMIEIDPNAK